MTAFMLLFTGVVVVGAALMCAMTPEQWAKELDELADAIRRAYERTRK